MSAAPSTARKLSSFVKCGRCRQDRQKCERPDVTQKCLRCKRYNHECDSGRPSNRAQRGLKSSARQRNLPSEQRTAASSSAQLPRLMGDPRAQGEVLNLKIESTTAESSRSASSERASSWTSLSYQEETQLQCLDRTFQYESRPSPFSSRGWQPSAFEGSQSPLDYNAAYDWRQVNFGRTPEWQRTDRTPGSSEGHRSVSVNSQNVLPSSERPVVPVVDMHMLYGLTNIRPSRQHTPSPFEEYLDLRIDRLWGNYKTFASASSKGLGVTPLFGRTLSELFRQSRQMAENGDDLLADVRFTCGAADACMNKKLSEKFRSQYVEAFHRYDARANMKYRRAVEKFAKRIANDESPDVLPLYTATALYYAAGACMRGSSDLLKATYAFKYFDQYTAGFPIKFNILPAPDGTWSVDMLLANNDRDPGMRINTLMFALGRARLEFDRNDGLC